MKIAAKVVGVAMVLSFVFAGANTAGAVTVAELQAQIDALLAQLAGLGGSTSTSTSCYAFTRDLTVGSTGADVVALQDALIAKGFLTIPAGTSKGYFGALTQKAVAAWQASAGIAPAAGYFGAISRGAYAASCSTTGGSTTTPDDDDDTMSGDEGQIKDFDILGTPSNEDVDEGTSEDVFAFEFEAEDSDLKIERLDFIFEANADAAGSQDDANADPWKFIESVAVMVDGEEVASMDTDSKDDWSEVSTKNIDGESDDDSYRLRFSGLSEIIKDGDTAEVTLNVTAAEVDDSDIPQSFDVALDTDGLRALDGAGIDQYEGTASAANSQAFTITTLEAGDVSVSELDSISTEDSRVVEADDTNDTSDDSLAGLDYIEVLAFEVDVDEQDVTADEITVNIATTTGSTAQPHEIVKRVHLVVDDVDNDPIGSESISSSALGDVNVTFDDLGLELEEGKHKFYVLVEVNDLDGTTFVEGDGLIASLTSGALALWDVEDAEGDDVTPTGTVTAESVVFYSAGITAELVSTDVEKVVSADQGTAGSSDEVQFKIVFDVTAFGDDDVFIDGDTNATATPGDTYGASTGGLEWSTTSDSTTGTTTVTQNLTAAGSESGDRTTSGNKAFEINDGQTRRFTLDVTLRATRDGLSAVELTGIRWATGTSAPADAAFTELYTFALDEFETELMNMNFVN